MAPPFLLSLATAVAAAVAIPDPAVAPSRPSILFCGRGLRPQFGGPDLDYLAELHNQVCFWVGGPPRAS